MDAPAEVTSGARSRLILHLKHGVETVTAVESCLMNGGLDRHDEETGCDHDSCGQRYPDALVNKHL